MIELIVYTLGTSFAYGWTRLTYRQDPHNFKIAYILLKDNTLIFSQSFAVGLIFVLALYIFKRKHLVFAGFKYLSPMLLILFAYNLNLPIAPIEAYRIGRVNTGISQLILILLGNILPFILFLILNLKPKEREAKAVSNSDKNTPPDKNTPSSYTKSLPLKIKLIIIIPILILIAISVWYVNNPPSKTPIPTQEVASQHKTTPTEPSKVTPTVKDSKVALSFVLEVEPMNKKANKFTAFNVSHSKGAVITEFSTRNNKILHVDNSHYIPKHTEEVSLESLLEDSDLNHEDLIVESNNDKNGIRRIELIKNNKGKIQTQIVDYASVQKEVTLPLSQRQKGEKLTVLVYVAPIVAVERQPISIEFMSTKPDIDLSRTLIKNIDSNENTIVPSVTNPIDGKTIKMGTATDINTTIEPFDLFLKNLSTNGGTLLINTNNPKTPITKVTVSIDDKETDATSALIHKLSDTQYTIDLNKNKLNELKSNNIKVWIEF